MEGWRCTFSPAAFLTNLRSSSLNSAPPIVHFTGKKSGYSVQNKGKIWLRMRDEQWTGALWHKGQQFPLNTWPEEVLHSPCSTRLGPKANARRPRSASSVAPKWRITTLTVFPLYKTIIMPGYSVRLSYLEAYLSYLETRYSKDIVQCCSAFHLNPQNLPLHRMPDVNGALSFNSAKKDVRLIS